MKTFLQRIFHSLPVSWQIRLKKKIELLYNEAGFGDTLLVGAVAREIKRKYGPVRITVNRVKEELLRNNPHVDKTSERYNGIDLNYHYGKINVGNHFEKNIIEVMSRKVGVLNAKHAVDIFLTEEELAFAQEKIISLKKPVVSIHTTPGSFAMDRKLWPVKYWNKLVSLLVDQECTVLQLGSAGEEHIAGSINMIGTQNIRRSIALIKFVDLHIGIVSSLMHGAAAVGTPAVILFGGFERFSAHGYKNVHPLESTIPCSPCIEANKKMTTCPLNTRCMRDITPDKVYNIVRDILIKSDGTLT